jgi:hypothetical protein
MINSIFLDYSGDELTIMMRRTPMNNMRSQDLIRVILLIRVFFNFLLLCLWKQSSLLGKSVSNLKDSGDLSFLPTMAFVFTLWPFDHFQLLCNLPLSNHGPSWLESKRPFHGICFLFSFPFLFVTVACASSMANVYRITSVVSRNT